jgi:DNA-directed RNA polymerase specialized sigma24 family protein
MAAPILEVGAAAPARGRLRAQRKKAMYNISQKNQNRVSFYDRFSRCRSLLRVMTVRILGGAERVEEAMRNCYATASRNPPKFRSEGAFRCWLIRILIDEALLILRQSRSISAIPGSYRQVVLQDR